MDAVDICAILQMFNEILMPILQFNFVIWNT